MSFSQKIEGHPNWKGCLPKKRDTCRFVISERSVTMAPKPGAFQESKPISLMVSIGA